MPSPPKVSGRHGLGKRLPTPAEIRHKHGYCADVHLTDNHPCAPSTPAVPVFAASNAELWSNCLPAISDEHHDFFQALEQPPKQRQQQQHHLKLPTSHTAHGTSHSEVTRLSTRPYALRASDPSDFASAWETSIIPLLTDLLQRHCTTDFAVDVHNFPEVSSEAVPRVIYVTLSGDAVDTTALEQTIRAELGAAVPERFGPVYLKFRRGGGVRKSNWWGSRAGERDEVCDAKNVTFRPTPVPGMSIGPKKMPDAASLGGFVTVGPNLYAMSALHAFEDSIKAFKFDVVHPAEPDFPVIVPSDPAASQYDIGTVAMCPKPGTLRESLTFEGTDFQHKEVEMDWYVDFPDCSDSSSVVSVRDAARIQDTWIECFGDLGRYHMAIEDDGVFMADNVSIRCLIGPVSNGKNILSVPSFQANRCIAVESTAAVEGNTEVYAMARTSGYSLGFTSDVAGLQRISGRWRREWTVRQYSPSKHPKNKRPNAPWQTLKQWVTSGIGVAGDSGAWLIRRSDNAVIGLIWGRNHDRGDPLERVRLTYFTPMVDILAHVKQKSDDKKVSLPVYSTSDLARDVQVRRREDVVELDSSQGPWNVYDREATREHLRAQENLIESQFVGEEVPASGMMLDSRRQGVDESFPPGYPSTTRSSKVAQMDGSIAAVNPPATEPQSGSERSISTLRSQELLLGLQLPRQVASLPGLSTSSSVGSGSSTADHSSEAGCADNGVLIVGDDDSDEEMEPVRSKASFAPKSPGLLRVDNMQRPVRSDLNFKIRLTLSNSLVSM